MNNLRLIRTQKNLSQQTVADALGINRVTYTNYENGKREPDMETLKKLAQYFGVSIDFLLNFIPPVLPEKECEIEEALTLLRKIKNLPPDKRKVIEILTNDEQAGLVQSK